MKKQAIAFICAIGLFSMFSCDDSVSNSPVSATENWKLTVPDEESSANIELRKHEDGEISVRGDWTYEFYSYEITCTIMSGTVTKDSTKLKLNCSGKAAYPPDEKTGHIESSPFTLTLDGTFKNGKASGNWEISFSKEEWDGWVTDGTFNGSLTSGSDVTD